MLNVIVRSPSPLLAECELTFVSRLAIDVQRAEQQHADYCAAFEAAGARLTRLPLAPELADGVFVEDPAVVLDEIAVITRPGVESRQAECASVAAALRPFRPLVHIEPPGVLEGGDVLVVQKDVYVGSSTRSNRAGCEQLEAAVEPFGYRVVPVAMADCLHLKTSCTFVSNDRYLVNPAWVDFEPVRSAGAIEVDPAEPFAANTLIVGNRVWMPASCPRTIERVTQAGYDVAPMDICELMKAEAGLSCMSLRFET